MGRVSSGVETEILAEIEELELALRRLRSERAQTLAGEQQAFLDRLIAERSGKLRHLKNWVTSARSSGEVPRQSPSAPPPSPAGP